MELKEVRLTPEEARKLQNELVMYEFAVREAVRKDLLELRHVLRGKGVVRVRKLLGMPDVPDGLSKLR